MKKICVVIIVALLLISATACASPASKNPGVTQTELLFADLGWDSVRFHNAVAMFVADKVYGIKSREVMGTTAVSYLALVSGEVHICMEMWLDVMLDYDKDIEAGKILELSLNFDDTANGFYVPRYVIEGDEARGIKPLAPDLREVKDLLKYKDLFPDEEDSTKGRIYGALPGWEIDKIMYQKFMNYGFDNDFIYFRPGSDVALSAAITFAYEKGEPIVAFNWSPSQMTGKYDLVLLEDAPYDPVLYEEGKTESASTRVTVACHNTVPDIFPEYVEFLKRYHTSTELTAEALAYISDAGGDIRKACVWFLKEHDELIDAWLPKEKADILRKAINEA